MKFAIFKLLLLLVFLTVFCYYDAWEHEGLHEQICVDSGGTVLEKEVSLTSGHIICEHGIDQTTLSDIQDQKVEFTSWVMQEVMMLFSFLIIILVVNKLEDKIYGR